ncbi:MAG: cell division protein ZapA [Lachnospiraceae bacterium]|jgi:cell division protein ZapA|nr:cell division protein ZapA [Lachnospiraceae bacterium]
MDRKNYAEVLIDGKVYTLGGAEEQAYLQKVAAYINDKIAVLKAQPGFTRQNADYQAVMIYLNLADDYFKTLQEARLLRAQKEELEKEMYSIKHELVGAQMKLEAREGKTG